MVRDLVSEKKSSGEEVYKRSTNIAMNKGDLSNRGSADSRKLILKGLPSENFKNLIRMFNTFGDQRYWIEFLVVL